MAATIDYVSDWQTRLMSRLYEKFKNKPKIAAWVTMVARQIQDLEDAGQALLTLTSIDDSIGSQLDNLGRLIGQPRGGVDDVAYRTTLRARILVEKSGGGPEDIYKVFLALLGSDAGLKLSYSPIKSFSLHVNKVLTRAQALIGIVFLRAAKETGSRALIEWQESATSALFTFDSGPGFDVGLFAGAAQA